MNGAGEYLYFNQQCVRYTGLDVADLMAGGWKACFHPEDDPEELGPGEPIQRRIRDAEGAYRWHLQRVVSQRKGAGEVSWVGTCTDVHDQVLAVEALRHERDRFSLIASVAPGVIYTYRLSAQGVGSFCYLSPGAEELFGVANEILLELSPDEASRLVHPDDREELERTRGRSASSLNPWHHEYRILHSSKGERWLEVHSNPVRDSDGATVWHGFMHDATDRRLLEAKFRQSQKMEAFGQLAGGVAHDFNNLLTVIKGYTQFSLEELPSGHPLWENLNMVLEAGERAEALTAQLLAFSRQTLVKPQSLCINSAVREVVRMLARLIGEDISIELELAESLPSVRMDSGQLTQLIMNLAVNARDAMPRGGRLCFTTSRLEEWVQLAVSDTGCGMSAEVLARIFEPFYTTKEVGKGTGLGLATAYAIADTYGGRLEVESQPGQGSTFRFLLPGELTGIGELPPVRVASQLHGRETILVVEDERALGQFLQRGLANHGYQSLLALNGEEALRRASSYHGSIDLLLTDVVMPGTDGRCLAEQILQDRPGLKVLYISGYSDDALLRRGILEFRENFLSKPFSIQELCQKVREVFDIETASGVSDPPLGAET